MTINIIIHGGRAEERERERKVEKAEIIILILAREYRKPMDKTLSLSTSGY